MGNRILKSPLWPVWPSQWLSRRQRAARPTGPPLEKPGRVLKFRPLGGIGGREERTSS